MAGVWVFGWVLRGEGLFFLISSNALNIMQDSPQARSPNLWLQVDALEPGKEPDKNESTGLAEPVKEGRSFTFSFLQLFSPILFRVGQFPINTMWLLLLLLPLDLFSHLPSLLNSFHHCILIPKQWQESWDWTGYLHTQDVLLEGCKVRHKIYRYCPLPCRTPHFEQGRGSFAIKKMQ